MSKKKTNKQTEKNKQTCICSRKLVHIHIYSVINSFLNNFKLEEQNLTPTRLTN